MEASIMSKNQDMNWAQIGEMIQDFKLSSKAVENRDLIVALLNKNSAYAMTKNDAAVLLLIMGKSLLDLDKK
jgi:hypothetical protein